MDIVFLSSINWDFSWHRQQEIMTILAAKGHRILFVEPGRINCLLAKTKLKEIKPNLYRCQPGGFPLERYCKTVHLINASLLEFRLKRVLHQLAFNNPILWIDRTHGLCSTGIFKHSFVVYDLIDEVTSFGRFTNKQMLQAIEKNILARADVIFATSNLLKTRKDLGKGNIYLIPNGTDYRHFVQALAAHTPIPDEIGKIKPPIIGFWGTVSRRSIDFQLLTSIAVARKDWQIILVGPYLLVKPDDFRQYKNIHFLGYRPYASLPQYLKAFDVCIIPYKTKSVIDYVYPRKIHEYFSAGKPVVSTSLPELAGYADIIYFADTTQEFISAVEKALTEKVLTDDASLKLKRMSVARQNTWERRVDDMEALISQAGYREQKQSGGRSGVSRK